MDCRHADARLERLEEDARFSAGFGRDVVRAFRKRMLLIRSARDVRDFYALKSLHYERLKGARSHQRSMRLNDQWRLIIEVESSASGATIIVRGIEDYHR